MTGKIEKSALAPMPWRDFVLGFQVASDALDNPRLDEIPAVDASDPNSAKLRKAHTKIQKDPFLRVTLAVQEHFGDGYQFLASFIYRFWALMHLLRKGHLANWITRNQERDFQNFHPAALLAAAEAKLNDKGRFPPRQFLSKIEEILAEDSDDDPR